MANKDELDSRLKMSIYEYYNCSQYDILDESYTGKPVTVKRKSLQLPQLIVKQLLATALAEEPQINVKGEEDETIESPISLKEAMHDVLAYGETFIAPSLYGEEVVFEILNAKANNIKHYSNEIGELTYIYYEKEYRNFNAAISEIEAIKKKIQWINDKENNVIINKVSTSVNDGEYITVNTVFPYEEANRLMPKRFYMKGTGVNGKAVYYDAINYINDYNDTLNDNFEDRDLSKAVLLVPEHMVESNMEVDENGDAKIDDKYLGHKKIFRIMPGGGNTEDLKPIEWRGGWTPDNYIKHINYLLHLISLHSGLGSRFLSYDSSDGLKTATEIVSEKDDLYKTKKNIDAIIDEIVRWSVDVEALLLGKDIKIENIKYYDGLIVDDSKKRENYFQDYTNGAIDVETYLELAGYDIDTINKVKDRMFTADSDKVENYPEDTDTGGIGFKV